jgi:lysophospholipase L1-like esterase
MRKILKLLFFYVIMVNCYATSCELLINAPNYLQSSLGQINFSSFSSTQIWLDKSMGDMTSNFNMNYDYEVVTLNGSYYFRLNGIAYSPTGTNQSYIYDIAWAFNMVPPTSGTFTVNAYQSTRLPIFGRYLATIGDSITHWEYGRYMRCLMRDAGVMYDFSGEFVDVFGFGNEGQGGNNTQYVLNRMNSIVIADTYFVLIGTNDYAVLAPAQTIANIQLIVQQLKIKNPCAKVYISTLLPRNDIYNSNVQAINQLLLAAPSFCFNCFVVDVGGQFNALPNWQSLLMDSIHPNYNGYVALGTIINSLIK